MPARQIRDPESYLTTRQTMHRVATHVVAKARHDATGRFGLRVLPGGFGTPMFGPGESILRVSAGALIREWRDESGSSRSAAMTLSGSSLADVAAFAGVQLDAAFRAGDDTPALGDVNAPLPVDGAAARALARWFILGASVIDRVVATIGSAVQPSILQLWPEHFDAGLDVALGGGRANLGISAGDGFCAEPYVYVGPWGPERPGEASHWNAPFGAFRSASMLIDDGKPGRAAASFFNRSLQLLAGTDG